MRQLPPAEPSGTAARRRRRPSSPRPSPKEEVKHRSFPKGAADSFQTPTRRHPGSTGGYAGLFAFARQQRGSLGCGHPRGASPVPVGDAPSPDEGCGGEKAAEDTGPRRRATLGIRVNPFVRSLARERTRCLHVCIKKKETPRRSWNGSLIDGGRLAREESRGG